MWPFKRKKKHEPPVLSSNDLQIVEMKMRQLGYDITPYGIGVALLSLESGYSHAETASHLASATLALDVKQAGDSIIRLMALVPHASEMIEIFPEFNNAGLMREDIFKNDAVAILKLVTVDKNQFSWIDRVLSDPVVSKERVANSHIDYRSRIDYRKEPQC